MREEVSKRRKQALKDFESAKKNRESEEYYVPAFLSQQAVEKPFVQKESVTKGILDLIYDEKALKALYIHKIKKSPGAIFAIFRAASRHSREMSHRAQKVDFGLCRSMKKGGRKFSPEVMMVSGSRSRGEYSGCKRRG